MVDTQYCGCEGRPATILGGGLPLAADDEMPRTPGCTTIAKARNASAWLYAAQTGFADFGGLRGGGCGVHVDVEGWHRSNRDSDMGNGTAEFFLHQSPDRNFVRVARMGCSVFSCMYTGQSVDAWSNECMEPLISPAVSHTAGGDRVDERLVA